MHEVPAAQETVNDRSFAPHVVSLNTISTLDIPPFSMIICSASAKLSDAVVSVEKTTLPNRLMVANCLSTISANRCPVLILNPTELPQQLKKNAVISTAETMLSEISETFPCLSLNNRNVWPNCIGLRFHSAL